MQNAWRCINKKELPEGNILKERLEIPKNLLRFESASWIEHPCYLNVRQTYWKASACYLNIRNIEEHLLVTWTFAAPS